METDTLNRQKATQFNSESGRAAILKHLAGRRRDYKDCLELQAVAKRIATDEKTKPAEVSQSIRAWVELMAERRIMRGIGLPKSVPAANDPANQKPKRKPAAALSESSDGPA